MALPSETDSPSSGPDTPTPISARRAPAMTQFPRLPRFVVLKRWQAVMWGVSYPVVVAVALTLIVAIAVRGLGR